jgi:hypothetical protein
MHLIDEFDADYLQQSTANFGNQLHCRFETPSFPSTTEHHMLSFCHLNFATHR